MTQLQHKTILFLRVALGWMFFYAGITKVLDPGWSAAGYLGSAKTFVGLFRFFATPDILPLVNFINQWGLTLLGVSLILGIGMRLSTVLGAILMFLYYIPGLDFPYPNTHSFIVDEHIIYIAALLVLRALDAGGHSRVRQWCMDTSLCKQYPLLKKLLR